MALSELQRGNNGCTICAYCAQQERQLCKQGFACIHGDVGLGQDKSSVLLDGSYGYERALVHTKFPCCLAQVDPDENLAIPFQGRIKCVPCSPEPPEITVSRCPPQKIREPCRSVGRSRACKATESDPRPTITTAPITPATSYLLFAPPQGALGGFARGERERERERVPNICFLRLHSRLTMDHYLKWRGRYAQSTDERADGPTDAAPSATL